MARGPGIRAHPDGGYEVTLGLTERDVLRRLPAELRAVLAAGTEDPAGATDVDEVTARLFPRAYAADDAESEYQGLVRDDLVAGRVAAVDTFATTLDGGRTRRRLWQTRIDEDEAAAWLSTLNDLRLVLAARLGVEDESDWEHTPDRPAHLLLLHLSWLQEELVAALSGRLA